MSEQLDTLSGLARILSSEPLPLCPMFRTMSQPRLPAEMEKWVGDLYNWLKKLFGKFTATNLITTINEGGIAFGFKKVVEMKIHYIASGTETALVTIDDTFDWRQGAILYHQRSDTSIVSDLINLDFTNSSIDLEIASTTGGSYPLTVKSGPNGIDLVVASNGNLQIRYNNVTGALDLQFYIFVAAVGHVSDAQTKVTFGNGS